MPPEPAKTDYVFDGWYTAPDGVGTEFTATTTVSADKTVYAKWSFMQYTITFNADGGSPATQTRTVNSGTSLGDDMPPEPAKTDYVFDGWYTAPNGVGTEFTATTTVSADTTVYAKLSVIQYTVTFDADGGSPAEQERFVTIGSGSVGVANMPDGPEKSGYVFGGWYTAKNGGGTWFTPDTTVTEDVTVYAWWTPPVPTNLSLDASLRWLSDNAVEDGAYTITLTRDETIAPTTLSYGGKNVSVTLRGDAEKRTVNLSSSGNLFTVASRVTLTLDNNIVLRGRSNNTSALVGVNSGGILNMKAGSKISGNTVSSYNSGGGVSVGGVFIMSGGEISDNTVSVNLGGGVYVSSSGTFTMSGGTISGNTASNVGGGVHTYGTFTMSGGEISGNTSCNGGGVYVAGEFMMSGGTISGNTASYGGGGVYVYSSGTFTKQSGGIIYGSDANYMLKNTADSIGHAVSVGLSKKRDNTAGVGVTMDSSIAGPAGGWE
jgi:uncharacterized repeat protein (TIGR02543 family)